MTDRSKNNAKPVLVAGATGAIGSEVVQALLERGAPLRVFVRSKEKVAHLPAEVERVEGCLEDREAIGHALRGVQAAFFVSPHDPAEERLAENFVGACEAAGVRLVFSGVHAGGRNRLVRLLHRFLFGLLLPHYRPKLRIGERVRTSRTRAVVLVPANYFQTDEICVAALLSGEYPLPLRQFPRVDARDVGDAAARALLDPTVPPGGYTLVGPASLTGEEVAVNWTAALGHPIRYRPDQDLTDRLLHDAYPGQKAIDGRLTTRFLARFAVPTRRSQLRETMLLLGRPPRSHADYARDVAAAWAEAVR